MDKIIIIDEVNDFVVSNKNKIIGAAVGIALYRLGYKKAQNTIYQHLGELMILNPKLVDEFEVAKNAMKELIRK